MKTDLSKQTKYYFNKFNHDKKEFELIEIPLNKENWFFVQIDASIRYAFSKYDFLIPKYVVIEDLSHEMIINIFRDNINDENELLKWKEKWIWVLDELTHQAKCNSIDKEDDEENFIRYEFKLL